MNDQRYQQPIYVQQQETNSLGVFGFCLMLLGYLTCGILAIPAFFMCGFAMFKEPRGLAIAGFILSIPAICGFVFAMLIFMGVVAGNMSDVNKAKKQPTVQEQLEKISKERSQ